MAFGDIKNPKLIKNWRNKPKAIEKYQFMYHFLPHPEKDSRAGLLSHKAFILYTLIIFLITVALKFVPKVFPGVLGYASNIDIKTLLNLTNSERESHGLSKLSLNSRLSSAAKNKASHMFSNNYWAHIAPDGTEPWDFILGQEYDYIYAGENLAKNFSDSDDVVNAWMNSKSHRENLLSPNYDEVGFAVVNGVLDGYETTLVVQMFGRPRNAGQVASVYEDQVSAPVPDSVPVPVSENIPLAEEAEPIENKTDIGSFINVSGATKYVGMAFGGFVGSLLALDVWYSRKKGILRITGNTLGHIILLIAVIVGIWFFVKPGIII